MRDHVSRCVTCRHLITLSQYRGWGLRIDADCARQRRILHGDRCRARERDLDLFTICLRRLLIVIRRLLHARRQK